MILNADARAIPLAAASVQTVVTSPPYWGLRDYGVNGMIGLEESPAAWVDAMVAVFREVRRVLRDDGTVWLNVGDAYANDSKWGGSSVGKNEASGSERRRTSTGLKQKDLIGLPWRLAFALQDDGWYLRSDIVWFKPNPMPESVRDRPTRAHEYIFLLAKNPSYFYDQDAVREGIKAESLARYKYGYSGNNKYLEHDHHGDGYMSGTNGQPMDAHPNGRNVRSVWEIATMPFSEAHFATFPTKLVEPCIKAGSAEGDVVLDPFAGSGTTGVVARKLVRRFVGLELNPTYCAMAERRVARECPPNLFDLPVYSNSADGSGA